MSKEIKDGFQKQRLLIPDSLNSGNDIIADINWNEPSKGKYIRLTIGDRVAVVKKDHLMSIIFMLGSLKEQDELLSPFVRNTPVTKFTKMIGITTTKDVKKGQPLNLLLEFTYSPDTKKITIGKGSNFGYRSKI